MLTAQRRSSTKSMDDSATATNPGDPNDNIQHLRAIAILFVLCQHFSWLRPDLPLFPWDAWSGVDLFFAISGFVISLSLARTLTMPADARGLVGKLLANKYSITAFLVKRFFRVGLPLLATLSLAALLTLIFGITTWRNLLVEAAAALSMTYNYVLYAGGPFLLDVLWSLAIEMQFYLLIPIFLIAFFTRRERLIASAAIFAFIGLVARPSYVYFYAMPSNNWLAVRTSTHCRLDTLAAGVFVFALLSDPDTRRAVSNLSAPCIRIVTTFSLFVLLLIPGTTSTYFSHNEGFSILALAAGCAVLMAAGSNASIAPFAALRVFLGYIGERSFSLYLVHRLVAASFAAAYPSVIAHTHVYGQAGTSARVLQTACVIGLTLLLAELMFRFAERPGVRIGRELAAKKFGREARHGANCLQVSPPS